jgi:dTDP-4-amino-4,6-dideoxygalactose transaminase
MKVPFQDFHQPYAELKEELDAAYLRFMESGWFVLGGETAAFEEEYDCLLHVARSRNPLSRCLRVHFLHLG